jgi:hypothetical protein
MYEMSRGSATIGVIIGAFVLWGCAERELYPGLPPVSNDGGVSIDASSDADADGEGEADLDADRAEPEPLECGYPDTGYGYRPGRALDPFSLETCEGQETNLPRLWCGNEVTIVHLSVAWCGTCLSSTHRLLRDVMAELEGEPVALVEILLEDQPGEVAGAEACFWWQDYFSTTLTTFIPPEGVLDGPLLWLASEDVIPLTMVLDATGEIVIWSGLSLPDDLLDQVRVMLR